MGDVVVGHGQNWELCDGARPPFNAPRALIDRGKILLAGDSEVDTDGEKMAKAVAPCQCIEMVIQVAAERTLEIAALLYLSRQAGNAQKGQSRA